MGESKFLQIKYGSYGKFRIHTTYKMCFSAKIVDTKLNIFTCCYKHIILHEIMWMKWNEWGLRSPLCTYRLNWARSTSWGLWDKWDDREETFCLKLECQSGVRTRDFPHSKQTALTTAPGQPLVKSCKHSFMVAIVNTKKLNQQQHANTYAGLMNGKFYRRNAAFMYISINSLWSYLISAETSYRPHTLVIRVNAEDKIKRKASL